MVAAASSAFLASIFFLKSAFFLIRAGTAFFEPFLMSSSRLAYLASIAAISALIASTDAEVAPTGAAGFKLNASRSA